MNPLKISRKYGCGVKDAIKRVYAIKEAGVSIQYAYDNDLFFIPASRLRSYFGETGSSRIYSKQIAQDEGVTEYEAYRQIRRALKSFGIPYATFNREHLFNATDEKLASVKAKIGKKRHNSISKIAKAANITFDEADAIVRDLKARYNVTPEFCYSHQLYKKTDEQIDEIVSQKKYAFKSKVEVALKETGWNENQLKEHAAMCSRKYRIGGDYYYSLKCYNLSDDQLSGVLVHSDIHKISAAMNRGCKRVDDKKEFCEHFKDYLGRRSWTNVNATFEGFEKFVDGLDEVFIKPVDGMHGTGARKLPINGRDIKELFDELMDEKALVAEEVIVQHPDMASFNPSSINTIRVYTAQIGDEVDIVNAYARFGNGGIVDNYSSGGFECGVDPKTGIIDTPGLLKTGEVFTEHPLSHIPFEGFQIPMWTDAIHRVSKAIKVLDDVNFVGWDVAITPDGAVLVEGNTDPGPGAFQRFLVENGISMRERFSKYLERLE